jgi:UDP-N-acetyl-D-glucosamine dehydrogenase
VSEALAARGRSLAGSKICLLGVAYKRNVDDPRESPAFRLLELLAERGAELSYNDPFIPVLPKMRRYTVPPLASRELTAEFLASQDCVLIVTDHAAYDYPFIVRHAPMVVDTRNATRNVTDGREKIHKA